MESLFQLIFHFSLCVYNSSSRSLDLEMGQRGIITSPGTGFVLIYSIKCGAGLIPARKSIVTHKIVISILHLWAYLDLHIDSIAQCS